MLAYLKIFPNCAHDIGDISQPHDVPPFFCSISYTPRNAMSVRPISIWVARTQVKKLCQYKAKIFDKPNFATKIISTKTNLCWKMDNVSINCFSSCASVAGHLDITWSNKERDVAWCLMDFLHKKLAHFCGRRSLSVLIDIWRTWNRQFVE